MSGSRKLLVALGVPVALLMALQLVPYGRDRSRPADGETAAWTSAEARDLARRACFDCHSNETRWPWYAGIAPVSWLIQSHVVEGREHLNFSAFEAASEKMTDAAGEAGEAVLEGEMPPRDYLLLHPEARLSPAEKRALAAGLDRTFAAYVESEDGGEEHGRKAGRKARGQAAVGGVALRDPGAQGDEAPPARLRARGEEEEGGEDDDRD